MKLMGEVYMSLERCDSCQEVLQSSGKCEMYKKGMAVDGEMW